MSLVLVLSVVSLALAEAGYLYNSPNIPLTLPGNQPANFQTGHGSQHHGALLNEQDKLSHSVSYKNYVYLKNDVHQNKEGHQNFINHSAGNGGYAAPPTNNGYVHSGYPQSLASAASSVNLNSNSAQNLATVGYNYNSGHIQNFIPISGGNVNGYSQVPISSGNNANIGYQSNNHASNSGYSSATSGSIAASSTISQPLPQSGTSFNNGYIQVSSGDSLNSYSQASSSSSLSHGYSQTSLSSTNQNSNNGYSQVLVPYTSDSNSNNNYAQNPLPPLPVVERNVNTGYSQSFPPIGNANSISNGYAQASSGGTNYNSGNSYFPPDVSANSAGSSNSHAQTSFSSTGSLYDRGYSQHSSNINSGYSQSSAQIGQSLSNSHSQPIQSTVHYELVNSNDGWTPLTSQTSSPVNIGTGHTSGALFNGNFNSLSQSSATVQAGSGNSILNTGFAQSGSTNIVGSSSSFSSSAPITSTVYKHIYFHVPPPEVEDPKTAPPLPPPKKNYKIIFIKVPSQESKSNLARLQQIAEMSNASVEHKTLIYVLVKNPETQQPVILPKSTPSEHEVFFVKYNGDPLEIAEQVNKELDQTGTVQSIVPLEPGLVNGKK